MAEIKDFAQYEIGIEDIDNDHRVMIAILLRTRNAIQAKDYAKCARLLDEFLDATETHFLAEEKILRDLKYPELNSHIVYHQELIWKAKSVQALCREAKRFTKVKKCFEAMADFLMEDIVHGDLSFKEFVQASGMAR